MKMEDIMKFMMTQDKYYCAEQFKKIGRASCRERV